MFSGFHCWCWKLNCHLVLESVVCLFLLVAHNIYFSVISLGCKCEDVFVNHLSILIPHCRKPSQRREGLFELIFSVWSVGSIVSGYCGQENIIVGRHGARKLLTSRQLLGKTEARDGRQRVRSQGQDTPFRCILPVPCLLKPALPFNSSCSRNSGMAISNLHA